MTQKFSHLDFRFALFGLLNKCCYSMYIQLLSWVLTVVCLVALVDVCSVAEWNMFTFLMMEIYHRSVRCMYCLCNCTVCNVRACSVCVCMLCYSSLLSVSTHNTPCTVSMALCTCKVMCPWWCTQTVFIWPMGIHQNTPHNVAMVIQCTAHMVMCPWEYI